MEEIHLCLVDWRTQLKCNQFLRLASICALKTFPMPLAIPESAYFVELNFILEPTDFFKLGSAAFLQAESSSSPRWWLLLKLVICLLKVLHWTLCSRMLLDIQSILLNYKGIKETIQTVFKSKFKINLKNWV